MVNSIDSLWPAPTITPFFPLSDGYVTPRFRRIMTNSAIYPRTCVATGSKYCATRHSRDPRRTFPRRPKIANDFSESTIPIILPTSLLFTQSPTAEKFLRPIPALTNLRRTLFTPDLFQTRAEFFLAATALHQCPRLINHLFSAATRATSCRLTLFTPGEVTTPPSATPTLL